MATLSNPETLKSADKELGVASESIEFKLNALKETWTGVAQNLFQTDQVKILIDALTSLSHIIEVITEKAGIFGTVLGGIALFKGGKGLSQVFSTYKELSELSGFTSMTFGTQLSAVIAKSFPLLDTAITGYSTAIESATGITLGFGASLASIGAAIAIAGGLIYGLYKQTHKFDDAMKNLDKSSSAFNSSNTELESLNNQLDDTKAKIDELNSKDSLTLTEQSELEKLQNQNKELERQIALQETLNRANTEQMIKDAEKASKEKITDYSTGFGSANTSNTTYLSSEVDVATKHNIDTLKDYYKQRELLLDKYSKTENDKEKEAIKNNLDSLEDTIVKREKVVSENVSSLKEIADSLAFGNEEQVKKSKEYYDIIDSYTDINLSPLERDLNSINRFFDGSTSKNAIKENLENALESGVSLDDALANLGLTIDDIGVENIDNLRQYFDDTKSSIDETTDATDKLTGSLFELVKAKETANDDSGWSDATGALKNAQEMYEKGKVGTDDFKTAAQFLSRKIIDPESTKYDADAYVKVWEKAKDKIDRYFNADDQTQSMQNALDDLAKKGLATDKGDGEYVWTDRFKSSTDAAKAFGVSVEAAESILDSLSAYGFEFEGVEKASEKASEFNETLRGLKETYDSMSDGSYKNKLGELIKGFEGQQEIFNNDLSKLSNDQVVKIKFEYDMSQIQLQIDEIQRNINQGGGSVEEYASLNATKQQMVEKREEKNNYKADNGYKTAQQTIRDLQKEVANTTDEATKMQYQKQISAIYDLQDAYQQAFSKNNKLDWSSFLNSEGASETIRQIATENGQDVQKVADSLGIEYHPKIKIDKENIQKSIDDLQPNGGIVSYTAEENGQEGVVSAQNIDGEIHYTANVDGVERELEQVETADGEIYYTVKEIDETGKTSAENKDGGTKTVKIEADDQASSVIEKVEQTQITPKQFPITATGSGLHAVSNINDQGNPKDKDYTITTHYRTVNEGTNGASLGGTVRIGGHGLASGTFGNGSSLSSFVNNQRNRTKSNGTALVGEEGRELVATRNGYWYTVGDRGAEFASIPKDSVVFNAEQTKRLLKNGSINSRGTAYLSGTAFLEDKRGGRLIKPTTSSGTKKKDKETKKNTKETKKNTDAKKKNTSTTKKGSKALENFNKVIGKFQDWIEVFYSRLDHFIDKFTSIADLPKTTFSKALSSFDSAIAKAQKGVDKSDSAAKRYSSQLNKIEKKATSGSTKVVSKSKAKDIISRIKSGKISIKSYSEKEQGFISAYTTWYEKYLDAQENQNKYQQKLAELEQERLDYIEEYYNSYSEYQESIKDRYASENELIDATGGSRTSSNYNSNLQKQIAAQKNANSNNKALLEKYEKEKDNAKKYFGEDSAEYKNYLAKVEAMRKTVTDGEIALDGLNDQVRQADYDLKQWDIDKIGRLLDSLATKLSYFDRVRVSSGDRKGLKEETLKNTITATQNGIKTKKAQLDSKYDEIKTYAPDSAEYQRVIKEIFDLENGIIEDGNKIYDSIDKIAELRFSAYDDAEKDIRNAQTDLNHLKNLLGDADLVNSKTGSLTDAGKSSLLLDAESINNSQKAIANYKKKLVDLEKAKKSGLITDEQYEEQSRDTVEAIQDEVENIQNLKKGIVELYQKQLEAENDVLNKNIDARKEALQAKKDYYDYDKTLKAKNKDINSLKAQIAALEGTTNAVGMARLEQLKDQLNTAQEDYDETLRNHEYEVKISGFDKMSEDAKTAMDDMLDALKNNSILQQQIVDDMLGSIKLNYTEAYGYIDGLVANTGTVIETTTGNVLSSLSQVSKTLEDIKKGASSVTVDNIDTSVPVKVDSSVDKTVSDLVNSNTTADDRAAELRAAYEREQSQKQPAPAPSPAPAPTTNTNLRPVTAAQAQNALKQAVAGLKYAEHENPAWGEFNKKLWRKTGLLRKVYVPGEYLHKAWNAMGLPSAKYSTAKLKSIFEQTGAWDELLRTRTNTSNKIVKPSYAYNKVKGVQLSGYAKGGVANNLIPIEALFDLPSMKQAIRQNGDQGIISARLGELVLPERFSQNVVPEFIKSIDNAQSMLTNKGTGNITLNIESPLVVNGNVDKNALPELKVILEKSAEYTANKLKKEMRSFYGIK